MLNRDKPSTEPRWPALLAILCTGLVYASLPEELSVGPGWLLVVLVMILDIPVLIAHYRGMENLHRWLGILVSAVLTCFIIWSLALLLLAIPAHTVAPVILLRSAATLWIANIISFALWYWRLDAGGPLPRLRLGSHHTQGAFLFPQMTCDPGTWAPHFIDYLFLSFNTSTALSPTDVPILSRWAKLLLMIQSLISLTIVVIVAARAVNIM